MIIYAHRDVIVDRDCLVLNKQQIRLDLEPCHVIDYPDRLKDGALNCGLCTLSCKWHESRWGMFPLFEHDSGEKECEE